MTQYLLDTNAISEAAKKRPNKGYMEWFKATDESTFFTSAVVIGEIQKGVMLIQESAKRKQYETWLDTIVNAFDGRVTIVDKQVGLLWGKLMADGQNTGVTAPAIDALIAAQCIHFELTLVTRNVKDFEQFAGLNVYCPWQ